MYSSHNQQSNSPNVTENGQQIGGAEVASGMVVVVLFISTSLVWRRGRKRTVNPFLSRVPLLKTKSDQSKNKARRLLQRLQERWQIVVAAVKDRSQRFSLRKANDFDARSLENSPVASSSEGPSPTTDAAKPETPSRSQHRKNKGRQKAKQRKENSSVAGAEDKDCLNKAGSALPTKSNDGSKSRGKQHSRPPIRFTSKKSKNINKILKNLSIAWPEEKTKAVTEPKICLQKPKSPVIRSPSVQSGLIFMDAIPEVIQNHQSPAIQKPETKIPAVDSCPDLTLQKAEDPGIRKLNFQSEAEIQKAKCCTAVELRKTEQPEILTLGHEADHCDVDDVTTDSLEELTVSEVLENQLPTKADLQGEGGCTKLKQICKMTDPLLAKNGRHRRRKQHVVDHQDEILAGVPPILIKQDTQLVESEISCSDTDRQGDSGSTRSEPVSEVTVPVEVIKTAPRLQGIVTAPCTPTKRRNSEKPVTVTQKNRRISLPIESETQLSLAARLQQLSVQIDFARQSSLRSELIANLQKQEILKAQLEQRHQRYVAMVGPKLTSSAEMPEKFGSSRHVDLPKNVSSPFPVAHLPVSKFTCEERAKVKPVKAFPAPKANPVAELNKCLTARQISPEIVSGAPALRRAPLSKTASGSFPGQVTDPDAPKDEWKERLMQVLTTAANIASTVPNLLPDLKLTPCDVACAMQARLQASSEVKLVDIRLNGSVAVHIVAKKVEHRFMYNDVDLIFNVDVPAVQKAEDIQEATKILKSAFHSIRTDVRQILLARARQADHECQFPKVWSKEQSPENAMDFYTDKMVCVSELSTLDYVKNASCAKQLPTECFWSLFSLQNSNGQNIEMKFVFRSGRSYQFATDSMQVILWPSRSPPKSKNTDRNTDLSVEASSGDFETALFMLDNKLLRIHEPNNLRGGGFLQFCKLVMRGFKHQEDSVEQACKLETAMLQQFLENNHMMEAEFASVLKFLQAHMSVGCSVDIAALEQLLGKGNSPGWRYNEHQIRPDDKIVTKCCWNASAIFLEVVTHLVERIATSQGQEDFLVVLANLRLIFHIYKVKHMASKEMETVSSFQAMISEMMKGIPSRRALLKVHQSMKFRNFRRCMLEDAVRFLLVELANQHCINSPIENVVLPSLQNPFPVSNDLVQKRTITSCKLT